MITLLIELNSSIQFVFQMLPFTLTVKGTEKGIAHDSTKRYASKHILKLHSHQGSAAASVFTLRMDTTGSNGTIQTKRQM